MSYRVTYSKRATKSLKKLDPSVRARVSDAVLARAEQPHVLSAKLRGTLQGLYKIKLSALGIRVVYQVKDFEIEVHVIAIGKRENDDVYKSIE